MDCGQFGHYSLLEGFPIHCIQTNNDMKFFGYIEYSKSAIFCENCMRSMFLINRMCTKRSTPAFCSKLCCETNTKVHLLIELKQN